MLPSTIDHQPTKGFATTNPLNSVFQTQLKCKKASAGLLGRHENQTGGNGGLTVLPLSSTHLAFSIRRLVFSLAGMVQDVRLVFGLLHSPIATSPRVDFWVTTSGCSSNPVVYQCSSSKKSPIIVIIRGACVQGSVRQGSRSQIHLGVALNIFNHIFPIKP